MFQIAIDITTTRRRAQSRTGKKQIEALDVAAIPLTLVGDELGKHPPAAVPNTFGQMMVADHPGDVQGFQADVTEGIHDLPRHFVQEVPALIGDLLVLPGQLEPGLLPVPAAFLAAAQRALQPFELFLSLAEVLGMFDHLAAIGQGFVQGGKAPEADINPHPRLAVQCGFVPLHLAQNGNEIFTGLGSRHGDLLHFPFHRSVKHGPHLADFGQIDPAARHLEPLRIGDGLLVVLAVVAREAFGHPVFARFAVAFGQFILSLHSEEVLVSRIQLIKRALQNLRIPLAQPAVRLGLLQLLEHHLHVFFAQAELMLEPSLFLQGQEMVIGEAGVAELDGQVVLLLLIGIDAELVTNVGHITAAAGDSPGEEAFGELLGEGLFAAAVARTLNALLVSQSQDSELAEFLTHHDH